MLKTNINSSIFSVLFIAVFVANSFIFQNVVLGTILLFLYLFIFSTSIGNIVTPQEKGPIRFITGSAVLISTIIIIGSVVMLVVIKHVNLIFGIIIIVLEVMIMTGGYIRKRRGKITPANLFGKTKMILQVLGVAFLLIALWAGYSLFIPMSIGTLSLAIVFAVISLFTYGI